MGPEAYISKFERVVELLRVNGGYTATQVGSTTVYEFTSDVLHYLSIGDYVITSDNAVVANVRVTAIVSDRIFLAEAFAQSVALTGAWQSLAPYSDYGTRKTINQKMLAKNGGEFSYQKYPLIALRLPTEVTVERGVASFDANILIAQFTNKQYRPEDRIAYKFTPILWPLAKRFIEMVRLSGEFNGFEPSYKQVDRMFYGVDAGEENIANVFDDPLDAVELRGLKLQFFVDDCESTLSLSGGFEYAFEHLFGT